MTTGTTTSRGNRRAGLLLGRWGAYAACVLALAYAAVSFYWAAGATAGLSTIGGELEEMARARDPRPLALVLLVAIAGEVWDMIDTVRADRAVHFARNWHDVWNTMFWPTALFLLARYTPLLKR